MLFGNLCFAKHVQNLVDMLKECEVRFRPKNVEVAVCCKRCRKDGVGLSFSAPEEDLGLVMVREVAKGECGCEGKLQEAFTAVFKGSP